MTDRVVNAVSLTIRKTGSLPSAVGEDALVTRTHRLPFPGANTAVVWELGAGVMEGVTQDEFFVVVAGAARVELLDTGQEILMTVGDVIRLTPGERSRWTVDTTFRKVAFVTK